MNDDVKRIVTGIFDELDGMMDGHGFKRRKNGLVYSRAFGKTKQKLELVYSTHPLGQPGAMARIYPWLSVYFPEVNQLAEDILGENMLIDSLKDLTLRQPIQMGTKAEPWLLFGASDAKALSLKIKDFFQTNTIPFLDALTDIDHYIRLCETGDKRLMMDERQYIYLACAYALKNDFSGGYDLVKTRFGKTRSRRVYKNLFEYFEQQLSFGGK